MVTYMRQLTISDKIYSCRCVLVFAAYSPKKKNKINLVLASQEVWNLILRPNGSILLVLVLLINYNCTFEKQKFEFMEVLRKHVLVIFYHIPNHYLE